MINKLVEQGGFIFLHESRPDKDGVLVTMEGELSQREYGVYVNNLGMLLIIPVGEETS